MAEFAVWGQAKKLIDAARHWAGGGVKDDMAADLAVMGALPEIAEAVQEDSPARNFEVWEENWPTIAMFMKLQTQWVPSAGGLLGLNYQSVEFLFRIEGVVKQREMMADLQTMEVAALEILNTKD